MGVLMASIEVSEVAEGKVGVLDKAMRILEAFPGGDSSLTPQEIATLESWISAHRVSPEPVLAATGGQP